MRDDVVFFDIDTQRDFVDDGGALPVAGGREIRANLARLTGAARAGGVRIVATEDARAPGDPEFAEFGPHCVRGTPGAEKIAETRLDETRPEGALRVGAGGDIPGGVGAALAAEAVVIEKRALSAFTNPATARVVDALPRARFVVYGVATEYCVTNAVEGLRERGRDVTVVEDAVRGVTPAAHAKALGGFRRLGVRLATTDEVLAEVAQGAE